MISAPTVYFGISYTVTTHSRKNKEESILSIHSSFSCGVQLFATDSTEGRFKKAFINESNLYGFSLSGFNTIPSVNVSSCSFYVE